MSTKCPWCDSVKKSKVEQTKHKEDYTERTRLCSDCGKKYLAAEATIGKITDD